MSVRVVRNNETYKQSSRIDEFYSDFNHTFRAHPNTGQIGRKTNVDAVKLALRNLILTNKYERLRNPQFGGNIRRYLFEPIETKIEDEIKQHIEFMIDNFERRVKTISVDVNASEEDQAVYVTIKFYVVQNKDPQEVDLVLYRIR